MAHDEALYPFYEVMNEINRPMWVHVSPHPMHADLPFNISSLYGWPFNSTVLMHCLVFGRVFDRFPNLRVVIHHAGAMVPFFEGRLDNSMENRKDPNLQRPHMDYFHENFYVDSVVQGSRGAMAAAYAFFGSEHLMYGTDMPFITSRDRAIIASVEGLPIPPAERDRIRSGNITKLLDL
jgi:aminocarboxymuconate-semialdehyde decarboxylase